MLRNIRLVEIEVHSHCNRKCYWCPNRFIDRSKYEEMDKDLYVKLLRDLKKHNFSGTISYSRYNEPMAYPSLFKERVKMAKEILPNVKLVSNTNGDFLLKENLVDLDIDELTVMDYDCIQPKKAMKKLLDAGVSITKVNEEFIYGKVKGTSIMYYTNWVKKASIEDRGGSLEEWSREKRMKPCYEPTYFIGIDYNGNVMPCCHLRSDNTDHGEYILGNLKDSNISEIYYSQRAKKIRDNAYRSDFDYLKPCKYCQKNQGRYTREKPGMGYE